MRKLIRPVLLGGALGGLAFTVPMWGELYERVMTAFRGSGGERADWGEALFYAALSAIPGVLLGGFAGLVIFKLLRRPV